MPKDTTRASVRTEVQPSLGPSGLRVEARPTGMSIPHSDYTPRMNPNTQLIANAFSTLAQVTSEIAREQIVTQRNNEVALGTQARMEAGDNADRSVDTMDKSEYFIKGYDLMSGRLGASRAGADLAAIYDSNPDSFVTQGQLQNLVAGRIEEDLQGVASPEMRTAYLEGMMSVEADLTAKNAKYQAVVAHTQQVDNFSAVVNQTFSVGLEGKSAQDLATDKAAMRELGLMNGLTSAEINKVLVTNIGQIAVETGRPELLDAFDLATQDTDSPDKTIPGLSSSQTYGPAIAEFKEQATRAKKQIEAGLLESRQNAFFKAFDAESNFGLKDKMLDDGVESGLISAEKARELRKEMGKAKDTADLSGVVNDMMDAGDYVGVDELVAQGLIKESDKNKILDKRASNLLTFFHANAQTNPEKAMQSLRMLSNDLAGTGRKSDVLSRELNPSPDSASTFLGSIALAAALEAQGASGKAVVAKHMTEDQSNRRMIYESEVENGASQADAFQLARSYGSSEAIEQGRKMLDTKSANKVKSRVQEKLGSYDPGVFSWEYQMANTAVIEDQILTNVRTAILRSGGRIGWEDALDSQIERFQSTHIAYKPEGSDVGVWLPIAGIDQGEMQEALDWYGQQIGGELGYAEGTGFYPDFQPGIGYVMMDTDGHLATRTVTAEDGTTVTLPVAFQNPQDVIDAYRDSEYMTPEEAMAAQAGKYAGRVRGPQLTAEQMAERHNAKLDKQRRREEARQKINEVALRRAQRSEAAIQEKWGAKPIAGRKSRRGRGGPPTVTTEPVTTENFDSVTRESIQRHEGAGKPGKPGVAYNDSLGLRTVGYGTLLEDPENRGQWVPGLKQELKDLGLDPQAVWDGDVKLNQEQMDKLFEKHYSRAQRHAKQVAGDQPAGVSSILTEMVYQMGLPRVMKFKKMREALKAGDYATAADEMLDSKWAKQTPRRAQELAARMRNI